LWMVFLNEGCSLVMFNARMAGVHIFCQGQPRVSSEIPGYTMELDNAYL
jgi:hypothetical protein